MSSKLHKKLDEKLTQYIMSETLIQEYIDTFTHFRDKDEIEEVVISPDKICLKLKQGNEVTLPKYVEVHRFIILGRRTHSA